MPKYSIVIRAYNEEEHIGKLLVGISKQSFFPEIEVILVDSGSTDATREIASKFGVKIVSIKPEDFSFGRALNLGCEAASGDFLIFASAHVYPVYEDWIEEMISPFSDPKVALTYGRQIGNEVTYFSEQMVFKKWFPGVSDFNQQHPFCNNANVAIRKELWLQFPYDESLTGLEDLAWGKNILSLNWKIAYNAKAVIVHVHNETPSKIENRYRREAIAMKRIFPEAKFSFFSFLGLFISNSISDVFSSLKEKSFFKNFMYIWIFRFWQFWGTYKGYRQSDRLNPQLVKRFYYPNELTPSTKKDIKNQRMIDYSKQ